MAFSAPTRTNVSQVVVTGPGAPPIATLDDLSGQEVFVRKEGIYEESILALNAQLKSRGKPAAIIISAPPLLEDDDVLEMVNAGLVPITVVDVADANKNEIVWRGMGVKEVDVQAKADKRDKNISGAVKKILKDFPPKRK